MAYVYGHYKADTGELFYIGKGTGNRAWVTKTRNSHWERVVFKHGLEIKILYDDLTEEEAFEKERELIAEIGLNNLTNLVEGGNGNTKEDAIRYFSNPEFRKKHLDGCRRSAQNPEWRKKNKIAREKLYQDPEYRNKRLEMYNREEWILKFQESRERLKENEEWRKNVDAANKRKASDPEWKLRHKEGVKKRAENPEWRKRHSECLKALWKDPEYRKMMLERRKKKTLDNIQ
jgi:hypothetical protein